MSDIFCIIQEAILLSVRCTVIFDPYQPHVGTQTKIKLPTPQQHPPARSADLRFSTRLLGDVLLKGVASLA